MTIKQYYYTDYIFHKTQNSRYTSLLNYCKLYNYKYDNNTVQTFTLSSTITLNELQEFLKK